MEEEGERIFEMGWCGCGCGGGRENGGHGGVGWGGLGWIKEGWWEGCAAGCVTWVDEEATTAHTPPLR